MNRFSEESKLRIKQTIEANGVELLENIQKAGLIWAHRHRLFGAVMDRAAVIDVSCGLGFQVVDRTTGRIVVSIILASRNPTWIGMGITNEEARKRIADNEAIPCGYFHPCAATDVVYARALMLEEEREKDLLCFRSGEARGDMPLKDAIPNG